jgi:hypothetical protein
MRPKLDFDIIPNIRLNESKTWSKIFLSFDVDWACDEVLLDTINILEQADVAATWFITHETPLLGRLQANPKFELGLHPNFNFLLSGDLRNGRNAEEVIDNLLSIVSDVNAIRSHSLLQSEKLVDLFSERGIKYISNFFIPETPGLVLQPWALWGGMVAVPHNWQDNVSMLLNGTIDQPLLSQKQFMVLDFHPLHVFLNTEHMDRYKQTRSIHQKPDELIKYRYEGEGTRTILKKILGVD